MDFSSINPLGVLLAVLAGFAVNFVWFGPIGVFWTWWEAIGRSRDEQPGAGMNMGVVFGSTIASIVVEVIVLAAVLGGLYESPSVLQGIGLGVAVGVGVAAMPSLGHRLFSGQGFKVWLLEVGADIIGAGVMGAVLAAIG